MVIQHGTPFKYLSVSGAFPPSKNQGLERDVHQFPPTFLRNSNKLFELRRGLCLVHRAWCPSRSTHLIRRSLAESNCCSRFCFFCLGLQQGKRKIKLNVELRYTQMETQARRKPPMTHLSENSWQQENVFKNKTLAGSSHQSRVPENKQIVMSHIALCNKQTL